MRGLPSTRLAPNISIRSAIYGVVEVQFDNIAAILTNCIGKAIEARSFSEPQGIATGGLAVFQTVITFLHG